MTDEKKHTKPKGKRKTIIIVCSVVAFLFLLPFSVYLPFVQTWAKNIATDMASESTGWKITAGEFTLDFPLDITLKDVLVLYENNDTMLSADKLSARAAFWPLLSLNVDLADAKVDGVVYNMASADSSMNLAAAIQKCEIYSGKIGLNSGTISLDSALVSGGNIGLSFDLDKAVEEPKDTAAAQPWNIDARIITVDNIRYTMDMLPTIDSLGTYIGHAELRSANINTGTQIIDAGYFGVDSLDVSYLLPSAEYLANHPVDSVAVVVPADTLAVPTPDWTITGKKIELTKAHAVYAVRDAEPVEGMDFNNLELFDAGFEIDNFYNKGTSIKVPIAKLYGREKCGIRIDRTGGVFAMDSASMKFEKMELATACSQLNMDGEISNSLFEMDNDAVVKLDGNLNISPIDVRSAFPDIAAHIEGMSSFADMTGVIDIDGTLGNLKIDTVNVNLPKIAELAASGRLQNIMSDSSRKGNLNINGNFYSLNTLKPLLMDPATMSEINFPGMSLTGDVNLNGREYGADMTLVADSVGIAKLSGTVDINSEKYVADIDIERFPVRKFLPKGPFGDFSLVMTAGGEGFNPMLEGSLLDANISNLSVVYEKSLFDGITATANVENGKLNADFASVNKSMDFNASVQSTITGNKYDFGIFAFVNNVDLKKLGLSDTPFDFKGDLYTMGYVAPDDSVYTVGAYLNNLYLNMDNSRVKTPVIELNFNSDTLQTAASVIENDFIADFRAPCSLDSLMSAFTNVGDAIIKQFENKCVNFEDINNCLPQMYFDLKMGGGNIVNRYLKQNDMSLKHFAFNIDKQSELQLSSTLHKFKMGEMVVDTIDLKSRQSDEDLDYLLVVNNAPGNMNQLSKIALAGSLGNNSLNAMLSTQNITGHTGFQFGLGGVMLDDKYRITLFPENPVLGFKTWTLNPDNYLEYYPANSDIHADIDLKSETGYFSFNTVQKADSLLSDLNLKANGIDLSGLMNIAPWLPKIEGVLNADATLSRSSDMLAGFGKVGIDRLVYNKGKVGDLEFAVKMDIDTVINRNRAFAALSVDGKNRIIFGGIINDTVPGSPYNLGVKVTEFPLAIANPFVPEGMIEMSGFLNGNMRMKGDMEAPVLNGKLAFDSAALALPDFGSKLAFDTTSVNVKNSSILFNDFGIAGINGNKIGVDGYVDIASLSNPYISLDMKGENIDVVNAKPGTKTQVFGKAFIDVDAKAKGPLSKLKVDAGISLLPKTDVTYVLQSDVSNITQTDSEDVVKFVSFADTLDVIDTVRVADPKFAMDLKANLNVYPGAVLNVNISPDGKNKVQLSGSGSLVYGMKADGDTRLTGRYTIDNGFLRYYPPFLSEKYFTFVPGSYASWSGDLMNPKLKISAIANQSSTVMSDGSNPAKVNFEITANIRNSLENLAVDFDLEAMNNNMVQTELQSMSASQRSTKAINLMLYNSYSNDMSFDGATNSNMLYSVLSSQLNNLASKVVKGVDLSFGINKNDNDAGPSSMNYSYQVSKSLFDNRFKMTVGGNYDTGTTGDAAIAQNLFSNVSFEYMITPTGTMMLRLYNRMTDNNIYKTQVNETGIAFIIKRKLTSLKNLFNFRSGRKRTVEKEKSNNSQESVTNESK